MDNQFESKRSKLREKEKEFQELRDKNDFEKGDLLALIIAALTSILPFALIIFVLLFLIPKLLLRI